ncbi:MAG: pilus assembly protein [Acidimicrobiia bacterium]|nr:pilus assembly protein [Acidimicrobiia bacterium]
MMKTACSRLRQASSRRRKGNTLVETAIGFLPLMALFFGLMDFSLVIFLQSTFQSAVNAGVRFAVTFTPHYKGMPCATQTGCIRKVVQDNAAGFLTNPDVAEKILVRYYTPDNLDTPVTQADLPRTMPDGNIVNFVNQTGNVIEVQVKDFPRKWMLPLPSYTPGSGVSLTATTSDVLQGLPIGMLVPPAP